MPILIHPVSDTELHRATTIETAAYASNALNPILFPGPFPPDSHQQRVDQLISLRRDDPTATYTQAIDTASGRMIAFAKWHIYSTPEESRVPSRKMEFGTGTNAEACNLFFGSMAKRKEGIVGSRPHVYLHMLHTDPAHQRHGAGSALMAHIKQKADALDLPIYLESSADAHGFYLQQGFKDVEILILDFSGVGAVERYEQPLMMRGAVGD
ncbi:hypothetical protein M3J09_008571 [Ascochyta lentis]